MTPYENFTKELEDTQKMVALKTASLTVQPNIETLLSLMLDNKKQSYISALEGALAIARTSNQDSPFEKEIKEQIEKITSYGEHINNDFMECDTCRAKLGTPTLCSGCLHNRDIIMNNKTIEKEEKVKNFVSEAIAEALRITKIRFM